MIALGLSRKDMAGRLKIGMKNLDWHIAKLKREIGLDGFCDALLTHYAINRGYVPLLDL